LSGVFIETNESGFIRQIIRFRKSTFESKYAVLAEADEAKH
jgi:hypothetical protein